VPLVNDTMGWLALCHLTSRVRGSYRRATGGPDTCESRRYWPIDAVEQARLTIVASAGDLEGSQDPPTP